MSAKAIREATGKTLLTGSSISLAAGVVVPAQYAVVTPDTAWDELEVKESWMNTTVSSGIVHRRKLFSYNLII